jgi:hypothetical protein
MTGLAETLTEARDIMIDPATIPRPRGFLTPLQNVPLPSGKVVVLINDLVCEVPGFGWVIVPAGFKSDLASTPSWLWSIYPPFGRYTYAAVVHDYLYCKDAVILTDIDALGGGKRPLMRSEADRILRIIMQMDGCRPQTPWIFWFNVRLAGWAFWHKSRAA